MATAVDGVGVLFDSHFLTVDGGELGAPTIQPDSPTLAAAFTQAPLWLNWPAPPFGAALITPAADPIGYLRVQAFNPKSEGATWDVAEWDEASWFGAGRWVDITDRTRDLQWNRGAESPLDRPRVGTASVTLANQDGQASPWKFGGPFSSDPGSENHGASWLQPGTIVRFGSHFASGHVSSDSEGFDSGLSFDDPVFTLDGVPLDPDLFVQEWLPFFTGRIEAITESTESVDGWVELALNEMTADLGAFNGAQQDELGAGDTLEQRIQRLLDDAYFAPGTAVVDNDSVGDLATYQPTALAQNRLAEIYLTADSVGMRALAGPDGRLRITPPYPSGEIEIHPVFTNDPAADELPIVQVQPYASTDRLVNVAIAARVDSTEQMAQDNLSISTYGRSDGGSGSRDDLIVEDDTTVIAMVQRIVYNAKDDVLGIESVQLDMDQDQVALPHALALYASTGLTDRVPFLLRWVHPSGSTYQGALVITGLSSRIAPTEPGTAMRWTTTISTSARIPTSPGTWDVDYWDQAYWAYSTSE